MAKNSKEKQREYDAKRAGARARGWANIGYPESLPEGWQDILRDSHLEILISPLHDKDKRGNGEDKKSHYHILVMWPNVVGESTAKALFAKIGLTAPP